MLQLRRGCSGFMLRRRLRALCELFLVERPIAIKLVSLPSYLGDEWEIRHLVLGLARPPLMIPAQSKLLVAAAGRGIDEFVVTHRIYLPKSHRTLPRRDVAACAFGKRTAPYSMWSIVSPQPSARLKIRWKLPIPSIASTSKASRRYSLRHDTQRLRRARARVITPLPIDATDEDRRKGQASNRVSRNGKDRVS